MPLSIKNLTRRAAPRAPFRAIAEEILGKKYELSLVFCTDALSKKLNRAYRNKDKAANVLSFPISSQTGEMFINLSKTSAFSPTHLFIHGCLHLKGMAHGDTMESKERKLLGKFSRSPKNVAPHRRRN